MNRTVPAPMQSRRNLFCSPVRPPHHKTSHTAPSRPSSGNNPNKTWEVETGHGRDLPNLRLTDSFAGRTMGDQPNSLTHNASVKDFETVARHAISGNSKKHANSLFIFRLRTGNQLTKAPVSVPKPRKWYLCFFISLTCCNIFVSEGGGRQRPEDQPLQGGPLLQAEGHQICTQQKGNHGCLGAKQAAHHRAEKHTAHQRCQGQ